MSELSSDSEGCGSFLTESESEHDSTWGEDKPSQKDVDYTATAKEIICENVNITTENALKLNSGYHNMLKVLKNKLEILLGQCQERQKEIEKQIEEYRNSKRPVTRRSRTSGYICGQPFFKDEDLYPGPHNEDYLYRKNVRREFFPLDLFEVTDTNWTVKDKVNILKGVKSQIVEFIERENRLRIRKLGNSSGGEGAAEAERLRKEIATLGRREIGELWEKVKRFPEEYPDQRFEIDWLRISNVNISERHSVSACVGIWNNYMLPGLVRDAWRAEEEQRLVEAVERNGRQDWGRIAEEVGGRSAYQCFVHYQTTFSDMAQIKHAKWTTEEDAMLVRLVDENRVGSNIVWNKVVEKMPLRNKIQCYNRYMFTLMRPTKNAKFTPEEDCVITAYVQEHGDDFKYFPANLLPGRTNRQIWARYNHTLKYVNKHSGWTIEDDYRLMNFIKEHLTDEGPRKISWAACSKELGNHSRLSCRTRYYTIEKFLEKNPDATLDDVPRKEKRLSSAVTNENWMQTMVEIRNSEDKEADENEEDELPSTSNVVEQPEQLPPVEENPPKKTRGRKKAPQIVGLVAKPKLFCESLRCAMKKKLYEKFKYSFHYRFGDQYPDVENKRIFCNQRVVCILLNCTTHYELVATERHNFTLNELKCLRNSFAIQLNAALANFLHSCPSYFLMPPNINTILGLRGVVLHANYPKSPPKPIKKEPPEPSSSTQIDEPAFQNALANFRARFRAIFYWTMLLARQNPRDADFQNLEPVYNPQSDANPAEHDYGQPYLEQQIALNQLVKLAQLPEPTPPPPTICLDLLDFPKPPKSSVDSLRKVRISRGNPGTHSVTLEQINDDDSLDGIMSPGHQNPQPATVEELPYALQSVTAQSTTTVEEYCVSEDSHQLNLVSQITVINPGDLPVVELVPSTTSTASTEVQMEYQQEELSQEEVIVNGEELVEEEEVMMDDDQDLDQDHHPVEEDSCSQQGWGGDGEESGGQFSVEEVVGHYQLQEQQQQQDVVSQQSDDQLVSDQQQEQELQQEMVQDEPIELTTTSSGDSSVATADESTEQIPDAFTITTAETEQQQQQQQQQPLEEAETSEPNFTISSTSVAHITAVTNVGDFVIEELEEATEYCETVEEVSLQDKEIAPCDEPLDLHLSPVGASGPPGDEEPEPNWEPEMVQAPPRKTYSRTKRSSQRLSDRKEEEVVKLASHAWRWSHLEGGDEDEIENHREIWERCDPSREEFRLTKDDFATELTTQPRDDVIVIDDDELEIKEEPLDVEEVNSCDNMIDVQLPPEENHVDESTIQQIIQTASNILRISETYRLDQPKLPPPPPPLPPPPPPPPEPTPTCDSFRSTASTSLIVQTPSRIFDEESNCYYYVDEVQEDAMNEIQAPEVEIDTEPEPEHGSHGPKSLTTLEDLLQHSLQATYAVMPQFATPQRVVEPVAFEEIPITRTPNRTQSTYGRRNRSVMAMEEIYTPPPPIHRAKRPPREPEISNPVVKHTVQTKALNQLEALRKQPRLPPSRPSSALSMGAGGTGAAFPSTSSRRTQVNDYYTKRPHSSHQMRPPPPKRTRVTQNLVIEPLPNLPTTDIKQEPLDLLANADEDFSAVDIIDALNSMSKRMKQERLSEDEEEDRDLEAGLRDDKTSLRQLVQKVKPAPPPPPPSQATTTTETRSVMQKMVRTIIETSAGRSRMDVHFKVAGVTIKKVQHK